MHFSHARTGKIGSTPLDLNGAFGISSENGIHIIDLATNSTASAEAGEYETLEMSPWQTSLKERLSNLIAQGLHGKAIDLFEYHMTHFSDMHMEGTLKTLNRALEALENNGFDFQVNDFIKFLSDSQLGMDIEFHNTGPNSPGSTDDRGEIRRLKHRIEAHYNEHRHMPKDFVPQYLGISTGPK